MVWPHKEVFKPACRGENTVSTREQKEEYKKRKGVVDYNFTIRGEVL